MVSDERAQIEAAFDDLSRPRSAGEPQWPPVAARIRQARERLGLSLSSIAENLGLEVSEYQDVEFHDDEVFTNFSAKHLRALGEILSLPLHEILFGPNAEPVLVTTSSSEIARLISEMATARQLSLDELSNVVGWELEPIVRDPARLADLNLDGLRSVCNAVDIDWVSALLEKETG